MNEMYCGKNCEFCLEREQTGCGGCRSQRQLCTIAQCCTEKGHESCGTCGFRDNCRKLLAKDSMPSYVRRQLDFQQLARDREAAREAEAARRAPVMAKWLWLMLWMNVPSLILSLLGEIEGMATLSEIGGAVCSLIVCWMLLQLKAVNVDYGKAAVLTAIGVVLNLAVSFITSSGWQLLVLLPAGVVSLIGSYTEYQTHGDVVGAVDAALGERWRKLWKWQLISIGCMLGGVVFMLIIPVLGALVVLAGSLAAAVVSIMTIVNLYRSAQVFRKITA